MPLILKIESVLTLSALAAEKAQYFVHLSFSSTLELINDILSDLQSLLRYINGTAVAVFFRIQLLPPTTMFPNNLASLSKDLKLCAMLALKIFDSLRQNNSSYILENCTLIWPSL